LYFVTVEHDLRSGDQPAVRETQTIVYREVDNSPPQDVPVAPTEAEFTDRWHPDSTALFRYSALTFNGHRIHYDVDYARTVEGYPNLVIHGPLLATLLLDALVRRGQRITTFSYRARSPLFLPDAFTVNGRCEGKSARLWAAPLDGRLSMEGEATCATA
jgi:3-methylfumaryl-CoA hydratase